MADEEDTKSVMSAVEKTGDEQAENTLLPMLVAGLALIVLGAIVVMNFV